MSTLTSALCDASDSETEINYKRRIDNFLKFCKDSFQDDFYIECAPGCSEEQIKVNKRLESIAKFYKVKMVIGTDAHFLSKEDRYVHKAYLNSQGGEREVDAFYEFSYLQTEEEIYSNLANSFDKNFIDEMIVNSEEIYLKIQKFSLENKQKIPMVEVKSYPKTLSFFGVNNHIADLPLPTLRALLTSDNEQERYWVNECLNELINKELFIDEYLLRLEKEADIIKFIGERLGQCLYAYFNTFKHYIDLFWECGSIVGPGRGSATGFLSNYLLGITQLDPIRWGLPEWRFLNKERAELPDIDIDLAPSRRPQIFEAIRQERGTLGLVQVSTFKTEGTKSTVLSACRGYRSEDYPDGIDVDTAQYISSLIEQERGFLFTLKDTIEGNAEKGRKPNVAFIKEVNNYPGLLQIMTSIESLVCGRSSHASGVILYNDDIFETAAIMKTPSGDIVTQFDLHDAEWAGDTKYDFLVTEVSDKIIQCINLLQKDNKINPQFSLREVYDKYLHPEVIDTTEQALWDALGEGNVLDVFQFNTGVGLAIAKKLKPQNMYEMTAASAMMRLMSERGKESQQDRFARIKSQGLEVFDKEMRELNLPEAAIKALHKYCDQYYGCVPMQEQMMLVLMDKDLANFSLAEANAARKIVAKKKMNEIPKLKDDVFNHMEDEDLAHYIWELAVAPSLGYAFSLNHSLPYSFVGVQTLLLATQYNPIYWNTACLIVNSGATDENKDGTTNYNKIAKAIGDIKQSGIHVALPDINKASFGFEPDVEDNQIIFGLKGMAYVGDDMIKNIIENRPYSSFANFIQKNPSVNKRAMVSLIKGGCFDKLGDRKRIFVTYIYKTAELKKRITLQNLNALIQKEILPNDFKFEKQIYLFNKYLKAKCKNGTNYELDETAKDFYLTNFSTATIENGKIVVPIKTWEKTYDSYMNNIRAWISQNYDSILNQLNQMIFIEEWNKYCGKSNLSAWEMESLCFYYHEHELKDLNYDKYGLVNFFDLPEEPIVDRIFYRKQAQIPLYKIFKIVGTCIAKDKVKSTISLLTKDGVVNVKFRKEYFALFDKQISEIQEDNSKKVVEKSWFKRGNILMVQGIRRGDDFIVKKYSNTAGHQLYRILDIDENGSISIQSERYDA